MKNIKVLSKPNDYSGKRCDSQVSTEALLKGCLPCQATTPSHPEPLKMSELPAGPGVNVCTDFWGPTPDEKYVFVITDEYSRYPVVDIVTSTSAAAVIPVFDKLTLRSSKQTMEMISASSPISLDSNTAKPHHFGLNLMRRRNDSCKASNYQASRQSLNGTTQKSMKNYGKTIIWQKERYKEDDYEKAIKC